MRPTASIQQDVLERAGKKLTFGALWVSLDNLAKKGYVVKTMADPTPTRGARTASATGRVTTAAP